MATIRKLPSGKYQVQARPVGLKCISKTFFKSKDAKAFKAQLESDSELVSNLGTHKKNIPIFKEVVSLYFNQYQGKDPSVYGRIEFWCLEFGSKCIVNIDENDIDDGLYELDDRGLTGSTINKYKSSLSAIFIFFIQHQNFKKIVRQLKFSNPVRKESVVRFKENPPKDRFLSHVEQQQLLDSCLNNSLWNKLYLLVLFALTSGARKGEMLNLKWRDIDFSQRTARLLKGETKNKKPRYLPLTKNIIEQLMKFRDQDDFLIFHSTISKFSRRDFKKQWTKCLLLSGIEGHCRFHDLRHTAASNLVSRP